MAYGVNILSASGASNISGLATEFVVDIITPTSYGNRTYSLGPGESLRVTRFFTFSPGVGATTVNAVSVSGGTVSWTTVTDSYTTFPMVDSILVTKVVQ